MKKDGEENREKKSGEIERREMQKQEEKKRRIRDKIGEKGAKEMWQRLKDEERRERKRCGKD